MEIKTRDAQKYKKQKAEKLEHQGFLVFEIWQQDE